MNSGELLSLPAMASPVWNLSRLRKACGRTRHLLRIFPVVFGLKIELHNA
jgi:hypothetical protein